MQLLLQVISSLIIAGIILQSLLFIIRYFKGKQQRQATFELQKKIFHDKVKGCLAHQERVDTEKAAHNKAQETGLQFNVCFLNSKRTARWTPEEGSLLEFSERLGLDLKFGCRKGRCGTCAVKLKSGSVKYLTTPEAKIQEGHCLLCIGLPEKNLELEA